MLQMQMQWCKFWAIHSIQTMYAMYTIQCIVYIALLCIVYIVCTWYVHGPTRNASASHTGAYSWSNVNSVRADAWRSLVLLRKQQRRWRAERRIVLRIFLDTLIRLDWLFYDPNRTRCMAVTSPRTQRISVLDLKTKINQIVQTFCLEHFFFA